MNIEELQDAINYHFINSDFDLINEHFDVLLEISTKICNTLSFYIKNYSSMGYGTFPIYSIEERFNFVRDYFNIYQIPFDLDQKINDGSIGFMTDTYGEKMGNERVYFSNIGGHSYYGEHGQKLISIDNTGYIFDSAILIHEISHYRNQTEVKRSRVNNLFTEAIAYTEEAIFLYHQYLNSHEEEALFALKNLVYTFYYVASQMYPITKLFNLYYKLGSISKENYKFLYEDDSDYEEIVASQIELMSTQRNCNVLSFIYIIIAGLLTPYLFMKYKEDASFMIKIQNLHEKINNCSDIYEVLRSIGLEGDISTIIEECTPYLDQFASEIFKERDYVRRNI